MNEFHQKLARQRLEYEPQPGPGAPEPFSVVEARALKDNLEKGIYEDVV